MARPTENWMILVGIGACRAEAFSVYERTSVGMHDERSRDCFAITCEIVEWNGIESRERSASH